MGCSLCVIRLFGSHASVPLPLLSCFHTCSLVPVHPNPIIAHKPSAENCSVRLGIQRPGCAKQPNVQNVYHFVKCHCIYPRGHIIRHVICNGKDNRIYWFYSTAAAPTQLPFPFCQRYLETLMRSWWRHIFTLWKLFFRTHAVAGI